MSDWQSTWGSWPENPIGLEQYVEGANPPVYLLIVQTPDFGPVVAGVYSTPERAAAAMARRSAAGPALDIAVMPALSLDCDLWQPFRPGIPGGAGRTRLAPWQMP